MIGVFGIRSEDREGGNVRSDIWSYVVYIGQHSHSLRMEEKNNENLTDPVGMVMVCRLEMEVITASIPYIL